jgi:hypothetical protein
MFPFTHMSQCERSEETPLHVMPSPLLMSQCERSEETPLHVMPSPLLICHSVRNLKKPHYMSCPPLYSYVTVWEIWRNPITCHVLPFTHKSQCEKSEETPLHVMPMAVKWKLCFYGYESPLLICYSVRNLKKPHYMSCPWLSNENCASAAMKALYSYVTVWEIWRNPITCHAHDCQMKIGLLWLWKPFTHMSQCEKSEQTPLHVMPSPLLICHSVRNLKKPHYMSRPWLSNENWASVAMKALYSYVTVW